jgi:hypothetical protein
LIDRREDNRASGNVTESHLSTLRWLPEGLRVTMGTVVYAVLLNDHRTPLAEAAPRTVEDCTDVLIDVLDGAWQQTG